MRTQKPEPKIGGVKKKRDTPFDCLMPTTSYLVATPPNPSAHDHGHDSTTNVTSTSIEYMGINTSKERGTASSSFVALRHCKYERKCGCGVGVGV